MTAILGYTNGNTVWIGGDSLTIDTGSYSKWVDTEEKVFVYPGSWDFVFGVAGSCLPGQLLRHNLRPYQCVAGKEGFCFDVLPQIRATLESLPDDERDFEIMVGYRGHLFVIDPNLVVHEPRSGLAAIGCGGAYALGYLNALMDSDQDTAAEDLIKESLVATAKHSAAVGPPFVVLNTGEANE